MKILVTGATGFVGQHVVRQLLDEGYSVIASSVNEEKAKTTSWYSKVKYVSLDLANLDAAIDYYTYFEKPDLMIHLAWEGLPNYKDTFHEEVNFPRHFQLLQNMIRHGLGDLTVTGTCFEYGMQEGPLREDMQVFPANPYAKGKDLLRRSLEELQLKQPFSFKWIRLFYMYGEGQNPKSLLSQLNQALNNRQPVFNMSGGEQVRDFLPVETVALYIVKIAVQKRIAGIINCCSGRPVTVKQFVLDYLKQIDKHIELNLGYYPYTDYEPMRFWGDNTKLKTIVSNE